MKKASILLLGVIFCSLIFGSFHAHAYTSEKLPTSQSSNHWKVEVDKSDVKGVEEQNGKFNTYSINVENLGEKVYDATVEVYRDEPNTDTKYELFSASIPKTQNFMQHQNQPISVQSKVVEVIVTWKEEKDTRMKDGQTASPRKFKQTFLFSQK